MLNKNKKHYIPSESEFRQLYIDSYPLISAKLKSRGASDKEVADIMVVAMTRLIRETNMSIEEQSHTLGESLERHCMEIMHRSSSKNPRMTEVKDELVLTEFMASITTTEAEILTNAYFHHYSDKESMKRMGTESVEEIRNSKLDGLKKLMALLNASPQLRAKLKQVI